MPGRASMFCLVCCCSRPAIISEPPEGSSTVVSARRTVRPGTLRLVPPSVLARVKAPRLVSSGHLGRQLQRDAAARHHHRRIAQAHAVRLELQRDPARRVLGDRDRELAADQELARLARHHGQVGLGQGARPGPTRSKAWTMALAVLKPSLPTRSARAMRSWRAFAPLDHGLLVVQPCRDGVGDRAAWWCRSL